ncbi:MAG: cobalamin B12-binding domain-containing protein [Candidatus Helarchaeota archaeon]|nr:cobalamin B12-binding domain-containing protein [Candidatus Helarchaeota archaeon]
MPINEILNSLVESIIEGDKNQAVASINKALQSGLDIKEILDEGIVRGSEKVGNLYEKSEIYLPELILSGDAMTAAINILKPHLKKFTDKSSMGTILIGTPEGDIHSIGKNIIIPLLQGQGYNVVDLGTDVSPTKFVEKAKEINPDVIGLSGLMTATMIKMQETIILLREEKITSKIILGGGIITKESCKMVGADDFATDGWDGIKKIKKLIELKTKERT